MLRIIIILFLLTFGRSAFSADFQTHGRLVRLALQVFLLQLNLNIVSRGMIYLRFMPDMLRQVVPILITRHFLIRGPLVRVGNYNLIYLICA